MIKRRIHTLIEYQFNKRTGKFDEVRDDVYEYDGPVTLLGGAPVDEWTDWAFYNDGTEAGSVIIGSKNTDPAAGLDVDTIYFFRVGVHESAGNKWNNPTFQFEYNYNTEGWNNVTTAAAPVQATTSGNVTNLDDTTQRMTSFTYISPNEAVSTDGLVGEGYDPESSGFEILYVFQIPADQVADGDSIELRVTTLTTFDFVNQTNPTFLVSEAAGAIETLPSVGIVNTVGNTATVTYELEFTIAPSVGIVNTVGNAPTVTKSVNVAPSVGVVNTIGNIPVVNVESTLNISPANGVVNTTGNVPVVAVENTLSVSPTNGVVNTVGNIATLTILNAHTLQPANGVVTTVGNVAEPYIPFLQLETYIYRWRDDDGDETAATWLEAANTSHEFNVGVGDIDARVRFNIGNTGGLPIGVGYVALEFRINGAAWVALSGGTTGCIYYDSTHLTDNDDTTEQLFGTGTFITPNGGVGEDASVEPLAFPIFHDLECEFTVRFIAADLSDGDVVEIRAYHDWFGFPVQTVTPHATIAKTDTRLTLPTVGIVNVAGNAPQVDFELTLNVSPTNGVVNTVGNVPVITLSISPSTGLVTTTGNVPTVTLDTTANVSPATGSVTTTGNAPQVEIAVELSPTVGAVTTIGNVANVAAVAGTNPAPSVGVVNVVGNTPTVGLVTNLEPANGIVNTTGNLVSVETLNELTASPSNGVVEATGNTPTVYVVATTSPANGVVNVAGLVPTVDAANAPDLHPSVGVVETTGNTPSIELEHDLKPNNGIVNVIGNVAQVELGQHHYITPANGTITTTGLAPVVDLRRWIPVPVPSSIWTAESTDTTIWTEVPDNTTTWTAQ